MYSSKLLQLVREFRGLTQSEVSKHLNLNQGTLSKLEHEIGDPDGEILSRLARFYNFPESFFYQKGAYILPPATPLHRKRQSLSAKRYKIIEAEANLRRLNIEILLDSVDLDINIPAQHDTEETPEDIARAVRRYWKLPKGPIKNLTKIAESAGIFIISFDFGTDLLDGFTLVSDTTYCIAMNNRVSPDRWRFSLAHEIGHIIMHNYPHKDVEAEANRFAAEFLLPTAEIKSQLIKNRSLEKIASLKPYWGVSIAALIYRSADLGIISESQVRYLWMKISKLGWRRREPGGVKPEYPELVQKLIDLHRNDLGYSENELLNLLFLQKEVFNMFYSTESNSVLRLIK